MEDSPASLFFNERLQMFESHVDRLRRILEWERLVNRQLDSQTEMECEDAEYISFMTKRTNTREENALLEDIFEQRETFGAPEHIRRLLVVLIREKKLKRALLRTRPDEKTDHLYVYSRMKRSLTVGCEDREHELLNKIDAQRYSFRGTGRCQGNIYRQTREDSPRIVRPEEEHLFRMNQIYEREKRLGRVLNQHDPDEKADYDFINYKKRVSRGLRAGKGCTNGELWMLDKIHQQRQTFRRWVRPHPSQDSDEAKRSKQELFSVSSVQPPQN